MIIKLAILDPPILPGRTFQNHRSSRCSSPPRGSYYAKFSVYSNSNSPWARKAGNKPTGQGLDFSASLSDRCDHVTEFQPMESKWQCCGPFPGSVLRRGLPFLRPPSPSWLDSRGDRGAEQSPTAQAGCRQPGVREQSLGAAGPDIRACTAEVYITERYLLFCLSHFYFGFSVICRRTW